MLTLLPTRPEPMRAKPARDELLALWNGLDREGRRLALAHLRALAETRGVPPAKRSTTTLS
ncbi:hypothetical protein [Muricoccus radiodurans]|uniref:hypothetical protein n=1 Tax=Muricoccus radiodurans TaxID=2231721 RepID=UPI003CF4899B